MSDQFTKYEKQRKPASCRSCKETGFTWYEKQGVTDPRAKKWYLSADDGLTFHEHDAKTPSRTKFTVLVAYEITAKDQDDANARVSKWGRVIGSGLDEVEVAEDAILQALEEQEETEEVA